MFYRRNETGMIYHVWGTGSSEVLSFFFLAARLHPAFGSFSLTKLPLLGSDWNTIWEIFHSSETSSLLTRLADQFSIQDPAEREGLNADITMWACARGRQAQLAAPLTSRFFFLAFLFSCDIWGHWTGFGLMEPWRFWLSWIDQDWLASSLVGRFAEGCNTDSQGERGRRPGG